MYGRARRLHGKQKQEAEFPFPRGSEDGKITLSGSAVNCFVAVKRATRLALWSLLGRTDRGSRFRVQLVFEGCPKFKSCFSLLLHLVEVVALLIDLHLDLNT